MNQIISKSFLLIAILVLVICSNISGQKNKKKSGDRQETALATRLGKADKVVCNNETEKRLDITTAEMTDNKFPENTRELRQFCNRGLKNSGLILGYIKHCLSDFTRRSISVIMYPLTNTIESVCKPGRPSKKARELIQASKCGNAARPALSKCYNGFTDRELAILTVKDKQQRIPMLCCSINSMINCFKSEAEEEKKCTRRTIDFVQSWTVDLFGDIISLLCREYEDASDKCNKVNKEIPTLTISEQDRPKSVIPPLIQLIRDLGEDDPKKHN